MTVRGLRAGLGDARMDAALRAVVAGLHAAFGREIAGYYVEGSRADGTAATGSDLDVTLVAVEQAPENLVERARKIARRIGGPQGVEVDLDVIRVGELAAGLSPLLKLGSLHVYGDDIRDRFSLVPIQSWTRDRMHTSYRRVASLFSRPKVVRTPLDYPNPVGELLGCDAMMIRLADGRDVPSTRDLVRHTECAALRPLTHAPWLDAEVELALRGLHEKASRSLGKLAHKAIECYERALAPS